MSSVTISTGESMRRDKLAIIGRSGITSLAFFVLLLGGTQPSGLGWTANHHATPKATVKRIYYFPLFASAKSITGKSIEDCFDLTSLLKEQGPAIVSILEQRDAPSKEFESSFVRLKVVLPGNRSISLDASGNVLNGKSTYKISNRHIRDIQGLIAGSLPIDLVYRRYKDHSAGQEP